MNVIFSILASIVSIYAFLCFIRIILTWIPQAAYSKFTQFLAKICDPFLNIFSKIKFLQIGGFDFGPAVGLCVLGALGSLFSSFTHRAHFSIGSILALIVDLLLSIITSVIGFIILIILIRLIILLISKQDYPGGTGNVLLDSLDRMLSPMLDKITKTFAKRSVSYKTKLIVGLVVFVLVELIFTIFFSGAAYFLAAL